MTILSDIITESFSTTKLLNRPFDNCVKFDNKGKIIEEYKFKINDSALNIQNSKFVGNPEDKFDTMLFLPKNEGRKGEGGLRTKGYFKHSYKYVKNNCKDKDNAQPESKIETGGWYIIDSNDKPLKLAPGEIQQKINDYISTMKHNLDNSIKTATPENIVYLPLISIITVVFNGAKHLEETILSILNQSYPNIEYIIIDGGSTDGTLDIIKKYENYIDYWISEPDNGIYDAMNKGISISNGSIIGLLNSGDMYNYDTLKKIVINSKNISNEIITGHMEKFTENNNAKFISYRNQNHLKKSLYTMPLNHPSTFVGINTYKKIGLFDSSYKICGDNELIIRAQMYKIYIVFLDDILSKMQLGGVSETFNNLFLKTKEHYNIRKKYHMPLMKNIYITTKYFFVNCIKNSLKIMIPDYFIGKYYRLK